MPTRPRPPRRLPPTEANAAHAIESRATIRLAVWIGLGLVVLVLLLRMLGLAL